MGSSDRTVLLLCHDQRSCLDLGLPLYTHHHLFERRQLVESVLAREWWQSSLLATHGQMFSMGERSRERSDKPTVDHPIYRGRLGHDGKMRSCVILLKDDFSVA
ncbi:hypothetical protein TNCV_3602041 [Trichonephila clavipes]|nr:hypothetical protein TNCV_3602041 [Trichonephila clavipes]